VKNKIVENSAYDGDVDFTTARRRALVPHFSEHLRGAPTTDRAHASGGDEPIVQNEKLAVRLHDTVSW
jgi:hypothetical protein